jgi:hypothetical protein
MQEMRVVKRDHLKYAMDTLGIKYKAADKIEVLVMKIVTSMPRNSPGGVGIVGGDGGGGAGRGGVKAGGGGGREHKGEHGKVEAAEQDLEPVQMDPELLSLFSSKGLKREVCARVCSKFGVSRVSDLSVLEDRDIQKLDLLLVDSRLLEQLVREIRTQGSKGKVPLPHAELQGNMDPAVPRFALTIGNNSYAHFGVLKNCRQDAHDMKTELEKLGFTTEMLLDCGKADTDSALTSWLASLPVSSPCVALMHFSGHGLEIDGENFVVPIDADGSASKDDVKQKCVSVQNLLDTMSKKFGGAVLVILLLDCCRENPTKSTKFKGSFSKLDLSSHVTRTFVGYATAPGSLADAENPKCPNNSPFTYALKDCLKNRRIASQVI